VWPRAADPVGTTDEPLDVDGKMRGELPRCSRRMGGNDSYRPGRQRICRRLGVVPGRMAPRKCRHGRALPRSQHLPNPSANRYEWLDVRPHRTKCKQKKVKIRKGRKRRNSTVMVLWTPARPAGERLKPRRDFCRMFTYVAPLFSRTGDPMRHRVSVCAPLLCCCASRPARRRSKTETVKPAGSVGKKPSRPSP